MVDGTSGRTWPLTSLIALLGFVFVPAGLTVAGFSGPGADPPGELESSPDGLAFSEPDGRALSKIDRWVESRVPGRELAFEFDRTTTRILDDNYTGAVAASDRVQLGDEGWLFLRDSTGQPCVTPAQEREWVEEIGRVETLLRAAGKQPVIAIAPDRAIVAPDFTGDITNTCQVENRAVVKRLAESDAVLDLADAVRGESHALQIDTHWSPSGAMAGARPLVEAIRPGTWEERELISESVERRGDLDSLVGFENTETVNVLSIEQPVPTSLESFPTSIEGRPLVQATTPGAAGHHVLLIHDSYGGYSLPEDPNTYLTGLGAYYVRPWFERVDNVRLEGTHSATIADEAVARSVESADTVAFLFVQRTLPVRLGSGSLSTPLAAALVDVLGAPAVLEDQTRSAGVMILDGWGGTSTESVSIEATSGAIDDRLNYPIESWFQWNRGRHCQPRCLRSHRGSSVPSRVRDTPGAPAGGRARWKESRPPVSVNRQVRNSWSSSSPQVACLQLRPDRSRRSRSDPVRS